MDAIYLLFNIEAVFCINALRSKHLELLIKSNLSHLIIQQFMYALKCTAGIYQYMSMNVAYRVCESILQESIEKCMIAA